MIINIYLESACNVMTNKMAARVLTYKLGSLSYGDSIKARKVVKLSEEDCLSLLQAWFMANGCFWMWRRMAPFSAGTNGE